MTTSKTCYVRLNRNFLDSIGTIKVSNLAVKERKSAEEKVEYSAKSSNSCSEEERSTDEKTTQKKVGMKKKSKISIQKSNTCSETSHSELSEERFSDEETTQEEVGKKKRKSVSNVTDGNNHKLRKKGKVDYFPESPNSLSGTSHSEFSNEESCTDEETMQEKVREKKHKCLKTQGLKKVICLHCDKPFSTNKSLLIHKYSLASTQFKCSLCHASQKDRQGFLHHMKTFHPEVKPFLCDYRRCDQSFKTKKLLEIHQRTHFRFMCKYCKQLFVKRHNMRKHVLKCH